MKKNKELTFAYHFERVAQERGLLKSSDETPAGSKDVSKIAAQIIDDSSKGFTENILKLCRTLRDQGFSAYAYDLEAKFLLFKKAEADVYSFNKETGQDVINSAHPKGSNQIGLGEFAEVETISDQHNKIMDVVNKQPKGKLASKTAIAAVKLILGQTSVLTEDQYNQIAINNLQNAKKYWYSIIKEVDPSILDKLTSITSLGKDIFDEAFNSRNPTQDQVDSMLRHITMLKLQFTPGALSYVGIGVSKDKYKNIKPRLLAMEEEVTNASNNIIERNKLRASRNLSEVLKPTVTNISSEKPKILKENSAEAYNELIRSYIDGLVSWKKKLEFRKITLQFTEEEKQIGLKWLEDQANKFAKILADFNAAPAAQKNILMSNMESVVQDLAKDNLDFYHEWMVF